MSTTATISAVATVLQQAWKGFCKIVNFKRRQIARAEVVRMARDAGYRVDMRSAQVRRGDGDDINNVWPNKGFTRES